MVDVAALDIAVAAISLLPTWGNILYNFHKNREVENCLGK
jgi:hypothetical protein